MTPEVNIIRKTKRLLSCRCGAGQSQQESSRGWDAQGGEPWSEPPARTAARPVQLSLQKSPGDTRSSCTRSNCEERPSGEARPGRALFTCICHVQISTCMVMHTQGYSTQTHAPQPPSHVCHVHNVTLLPPYTYAHKYMCIILAYILVHNMHKATWIVCMYVYVCATHDTHTTGPQCFPCSAVCLPSIGCFYCCRFPACSFPCSRRRSLADHVLSLALATNPVLWPGPSPEC